MDNNLQRDYDEMFRESQINRYPKSERPKSPYDEQFRRSQAQKKPLPEQPEVLDATGRPIRQPSRVSSESLGVVSVILGVTAFVLVFVGMFFHFFMWLNILVCLVGIGFGVAALIKGAVGRVLGVIGVVVCIFDLVVELICMIIVAISSGVSAVFRLLT